MTILGNGKGRRGCKDIDECKKNVCRVGSRCVNTRGSYRCIDIDECANGTHKCDENAQCENANEGYINEGYNGSYSCTCNEGFIGNINFQSIIGWN